MLNYDINQMRSMNDGASGEYHQLKKQFDDLQKHQNELQQKYNG